MLVITSEKVTLRKQAVQMLRRLDAEERSKITKRLNQQLLSSELWQSNDTIGLTISQGHEWETREIIKKAWEAGKSVCVPKCFPESSSLIFYQIKLFEQLESVYYNLLEPIPSKTTKVDKSDIQVIVVPGLLFDFDGYRIGHGGGYYDRFLADYQGETVSLVWSEQLIKTVPKEKYDIPVYHIITENGLFK